jgi:HPt (histidine-containing phosphotransfer) domain-containing protein
VRRKADIESLRTALDDDRLDEIKITGHNMSGSGSAYGLDRVSEIGAGLEAAAGRGDRAAITRLIDDLHGYVSDLRLT